MARGRRRRWITQRWQHRISRFCAVALVTLIFLPVTAPFKTIDLAGSSTTGAYDWLPKDKIDFDEKDGPPSDWFLPSLALNSAGSPRVVRPNQIQAHPSQRAILRV